MAEVPEQFHHNHLILSKVKQFNYDGKYWDVRIRVDEEVFKCQRSILAANSEYFNTMFSSSDFEESNATANQIITLRKIDATAFKELLSFMYTGDICVKDSNVLQLLSTNDFLQLSTGLVKQRCLEYMKWQCEVDNPTSFTFDFLCFAHSEEDNELVDILNAHVCRHLNYYYSSDANFMEIPSEILSALLEFSRDYILPIPGSADILLKIVHKWIDHDREGRSQYRNNLMENIDFAHISPNFARSLIDGRENLVDEVVNFPNDSKSSELKIIAMEMDNNFSDGSAQFDGIITFVVENVNEFQIDQKVYSSSCIFSNLSWKMCIERDNCDELWAFLICDGTDLCEEWNCYASAILTIVSQNEGGRDFVMKLNRCIFSSDSDPNGEIFCTGRWNDVIDPEKGYINEDSSVTLHAHVYVDVLFPKTM